jgi:hypothetical protein
MAFTVVDRYELSRNTIFIIIYVVCSIVRLSARKRFLRMVAALLFNSSRPRHHPSRHIQPPP